MDYRVIVSPTKGFWTEHGWQKQLALATQLPNDTEVVLSFKDASDIKLIRRKDIQSMTRYAFLSFLMKVCLKRALKQSDNSLLSQFIQIPILSDGNVLTLDNKTMTLDAAERFAVSLVWGSKPDADHLVYWGRKFLDHHVAAGDNDTIYIISLSSPARAAWLNTPDRFRSQA